MTSELPAPGFFSASRGVPADDPERAAIDAQFKVWGESLVDMTKRNPLLGINRARTAKLQVRSPESAAIFGILVHQHDKLRLPFVVPSRSEAGEPAFDVTPGDVEFEALPADIMRRLQKLRDNARTTVEERGVTTLHITFGTIEWEDAYLGNSIAPLILVPCEFQSDGIDKPLRLVATDDDVQINPALRAYLRQRFKTDIPDIADDLADCDMHQLFASARSVLGKGFAIKEDVWLGTFSYEALVIQHDLEALADSAHSSDVVRALCRLPTVRDGEASEVLGQEIDAEPVDTVVPIPALDADSSQLEALTQARSGKHLLVYGPPGTGKSQTIANLIADALGRGRTVLFVSAKVAALEVVFHRLDELGFGRFCLEAHSTKASKRQILDNLSTSMELAASTASVDYSREIERYTTLRNILNAAVKELHYKRVPLDISVYTGLGTLAKLDVALDVRAPLPWTDTTTINSSMLDTVRDLLGELQSKAQVYAFRDTHPWHGCLEGEASVVVRETLLDALEIIVDTCKEVTANAAQLCDYTDSLHGMSFEELERHAGILAMLSSCDWLPLEWRSLDADRLDAIGTELSHAAQMAAELAVTTARFGERTGGADPFEAQGVLAGARSRFGHWYQHQRVNPAYVAWRRDVRRVVHPAAMDFASLAELASMAARIGELQQALDASQPDLDLHLRARGQPWPDAGALTAAAAAFTCAAGLRRLVAAPTGGLGPSGPEDVPQSVRMAAQQLVACLPSARPRLAEALNRIDASWRMGFVGGAPASETPTSQLMARCYEAHATPERFTEWVDLCRLLARLDTAGLSPFVAALHSSVDDAVRQFDRRFWHLWCDAHIHRSEALREFQGAVHEDLASRFAALDKRLSQLARQAAIARAAGPAGRAALNPEPSGHSELGILKREIAKKKRNISLRRLFNSCPRVIQAIKPCMMMSPVSVSTFLATGTLAFDIVVFDEASQLPPAEAIPSILRARQVVVAGDDQQLPPTSFFASSLFEPDDDDDENDPNQPNKPLDSLLEECQASAGTFCESHLRWHYRSRDERLITFSNYHFYNGKLITTPSPGPIGGRGIFLHYVENGVWQKGKSRTNAPEARRVIDILVDQLDKYPGRSIGIVALSSTQAEAIEDALTERVRERRDLEAQLAALPAPYFIKALEHVQGDERDVMIISTGYGRDPQGGFSLNFGPINQSGGHRRLNVLVTRARDATILVTSLRSTDLGGSPAENLGRERLRQFIAYAERGGNLLPEEARVTKAETNDFEDAIAEALRSRGLQISEQVGVSSFRIDLAVRDPRDPNWYCLGIECDGATYHSSRSARDRDVLREDLLRRMGWEIHRIWSTDWFKNPVAEIDAVVHHVETVLAAGRPTTGYPAEPLPHLATSAASETVPTPRAVRPDRYPGGVSYEICSHNPRQSDRSLLLDRQRSQALIRETARIVRAEQPVHPSVVLGRLKSFHAVQHAGSNVQANFTYALDSAVRGGYITLDNDGFLWCGGSTVDRFRVHQLNDITRDVEFIHPQEIQLAALHVVAADFGVPKNELIVRTAKVLGYERTSEQIRETIVRAIDRALADGLLREGGDRVELA